MEFEILNLPDQIGPLSYETEISLKFTIKKDNSSNIDKLIVSYSFTDDKILFDVKNDETFKVESHGNDGLAKKIGRVQTLFGDETYCNDKLTIKNTNKERDEGYLEIRLKGTGQYDPAYTSGLVWVKFDNDEDNEGLIRKMLSKISGFFTG